MQRENGDEMEVGWMVGLWEGDGGLEVSKRWGLREDGRSGWKGAAEGGEREVSGWRWGQKGRRSGGGQLEVQLKVGE